MLDSPLTKGNLGPRIAVSPSPQLRKVAIVGNFPPRCCGIATFTLDLSEAIGEARPLTRKTVVAMNDRERRHAYDARVGVEIGQERLEDYLAAAERLNAEGVDAVCIQHEFGIFGGPAGEHVLLLYRALRCPIVTTLHTVLERPNADQRRVMEAIIELSAKLVVMTQKGHDILTRVYGVSSARVTIIPHGAPDRPLPHAADAKGDWAGRDVILTFGLLSPNKGIESVIRALPRIVEARPNVLYVVLGATHPHLIEREGEAYRTSLKELAASLGVADHVEFVDRFVDTELLVDYLRAADIYVTPYLHEAQVTSGTLAYALALGKPVVSTPYWHASEALADDVGVLVDFGASDQIASAVTRLLEDDSFRLAMGRRAYRRARPTIWSNIGVRYAEVMEQAIATRAPMRRASPRAVPKISTSALERMTDSCGILQHGRFGVADRLHGYCLDDNARALLATQRLSAIGPSNVAERLAPTYASFIEHAWNPEAARFRNFMSYDRGWLEDVGSEDSFGRGLWAIGEIAAHARDRELRAWALHLAQRVAPHAEDLISLHAQAFATLGLAPLAQIGDEAAVARLAKVAMRVHASLLQSRRTDWLWFESVLAYDNARLPEALLRAGAVLGDSMLVDAGVDALAWLMDVQTGAGGVFRAVGSESFGAAYAQPKIFDQQPIEACASIDACWAAFDATGDSRWSFEAQRAFAWFLGGNDLGVEIALPDSGGCFDGLCRHGPNRNQGAESILSYLLSACAMRMRAAKLGAALS